MAGNLDRKLRLPRIHFRVVLHAAYMRHGTNGFTSLPKEEFFSPWKFRRPRQGLNSRTWVPKASTLPLEHRNRYVQILRKFGYGDLMNKFVDVRLWHDWLFVESLHESEQDRERGKSVSQDKNKDINFWHCIYSGPVQMSPTFHGFTHLFITQST